MLKRAKMHIFSILRGLRWQMESVTGINLASMLVNLPKNWLIIVEINLKNNSDFLHFPQERNIVLLFQIYLRQWKMVRQSHIRGLSK